jgi:hypothetical protein
LVVETFRIDGGDLAMKVLRLFFLAAFALGTVSAASAGWFSDLFRIDSGSERLAKEMKETRETLDRLTYDTVPGALWTKLLRMSHEGSPEQRKQAEETIKSYFGIDVSRPYAARIWVEYGGSTPIEFDAFLAPTNGAGEISNFLGSDQYQRRLVGPNSNSLLTAGQKRDQFTSKLADALLKVTNLQGTCRRCEYGDACTIDDGCLRKQSSALSANMREMLSDYFAEDFRPTTQNSLEIPWTIARPYLFILVRKDQYDSIAQSKTRLVVKASVAPKDNPSDTFASKGIYEFLLEQFHRFPPIKDLDRDVLYIAAVHNMGDHGFDKPEEVKAIRALTEKWNSLDSKVGSMK